MNRLKPKQPASGCQAGGQRFSAIEGSIQRTAGKTHASAEAWGKKRHSYKPLPTQFRHDAFDHRQIYREGDFAIYEQSCGGCPDPSVCYEIVRIRRREGFEIGGRFVEPAEIYPKSEAWGVDGFTLIDREAAFAKFREIGR